MSFWNAPIDSYDRVGCFCLAGGDEDAPITLVNGSYATVKGDRAITLTYLPRIRASKRPSGLTVPSTAETGGGTASLNWMAGRSVMNSRPFSSRITRRRLSWLNATLALGDDSGRNINSFVNRPSQICTVPSCAPTNTRVPSELKATGHTSFFTLTATNSIPVPESQTLAVPSNEPVRTRVPSGLHTAEREGPVCPRSTASSLPAPASQILTVPSSEAVNTL